MKNIFVVLGYKKKRSLSPDLCENVFSAFRVPAQWYCGYHHSKAGIYRPGH